MKGKLVLPVVLLTLLLVGVVRAQTGGNYDLSWNVVSAGGGQSSGGDFRLEGTAGQAAPGLSSGGNSALKAGFWWGAVHAAPPAGPCYLPVVLKNFFCDRYERNDSRDTAWGLWTSGQIINDAQICQGDPRDVYYFDASGAVQVTINLTSMPGNADFGLYLWDETGSTELVGSRNGAGQDEQIVYTLPGAGPYYVDVYPWSGTGSYTLQGSGW